MVDQEVRAEVQHDARFRVIIRRKSSAGDQALSISAPGADADWIIIPRNLAAASDRVLDRWCSAAARSVLPRRFLRQHPAQFPLQASLGAAARMTAEDHQRYVLRATLPDEYLSIELHWRPLGSDPVDTLRQLAAPRLAQVEVGPPERRDRGTDRLGFVASLSREHQPHGYVRAFALGPLALRVTVDLPPRLEDRALPSIERLLDSLQVDEPRRPARWPSPGSA